MGGTVRVAFCCVVFVICGPRESDAQQYLNCKSWLQLNSADRVASAASGNVGALSAVQPIADALPKDRGEAILDDLRKCLSTTEPAIVDNLDALCAHDPSSDYPAFRSVIDNTTRQCTQEASARLAQ